jgi:exonuclease SbcC
MIPVRLKISGFLSYRNPVEIDFTGFDVACISGHNGAGKSTLLDAMTWALFGQARRRDDALINNACTAAEVILDFDYEGNRYRVQRSKARDKSTLLEIFIRGENDLWRPLTEHALRETEQRIQSILRMDYETFTNASFFLQGKADQFAQQRPADRKRILANVLGLEIWETYRNEAALRRKQVDNNITALEGQLQEIESELSEEDARRERLNQLEQALEQQTELRKSQETVLENQRRLAATLAEQARMVSLLRTQWEESSRRLTQRETLLAQRSAESAKFQQTLADAGRIEAEYAQWQSLNRQLQQQSGLAEKFQQIERQRSKQITVIESETARLTEELRSLQQRGTEYAAQQARLPALETQLKEFQQAVSLWQTRLEERSQLNHLQQDVSEQSATLKAEKNRLQDAMNEIHERIQRLKDSSGDCCPLCGQPLGPQEKQNLLAELQQQGTALGNQYRANKERLNAVDQQLNSLNASLIELGKVDASLHQAQRSLAQVEAQRESLLSAQQQWLNQHAPRLETLTSLLAEKRFAESARETLAGLDQALAALGYDESAHAALRAAEENLRASQDDLRRLENARAALAPLEREIQSLQAEINSGRQEVDQQAQAYQNAKAVLENQQAEMPDLKRAESDLTALKTQENQLRTRIGAARQMVDVLGVQKERRSELGKQRDELRLMQSRYKTLERTYSKDGIPALLIEQALPEIQEQANDFLRQLSNDSMSVEFSTQRDYKDRQRDEKRETLDILISDSAGTREYEMFSGGEAFRVNFSIRLALSRVLSRRASARLQTLVIDEGFGSQDAEGRQRLIEAINLARPDFAKILVITHLEELKDAFPARIEIEKTEQGSSVQVLVA